MANGRSVETAAVLSSRDFGAFGHQRRLHVFGACARKAANYYRTDYAARRLVRFKDPMTN